MYILSFKNPKKYFDLYALYKKTSVLLTNRNQIYVLQNSVTRWGLMLYFLRGAKAPLFYASQYYSSLVLGWLAAYIVGTIFSKFQPFCISMWQ